MLRHFIIYAAWVVFGIFLARYSILAPPLHGFLNNPFDLQMRHYPELAKFKARYHGKLNIINVFYGGEPYVVFTHDFFPNSANSEKVALRGLKADGILREFLRRGFVVDDFKKQVEEEVARAAA